MNAKELLGVITVVRPFQAGDVVFLQATRPLSRDMFVSLREYAETAIADSGVRIVVLDDALRIVGKPQDISNSDAAPVGENPAVAWLRDGEGNDRRIELHDGSIVVDGYCVSSLPKFKTDGELASGGPE